MFFEFALIGCTACGKSELASRLAAEFNAFILSLDSLCVYKEINIASAKPDDTQCINYFGINLLSVDEAFNVALFFKEYKRAKNAALKANKPLIIVGGTSFYLKALMSGLSKEVPALLHYELDNEAIYALVKRIDKKAKIEKNDTYRLRKWLDIYEFSKEVPSEFLKRTLKPALIKKLDIFELVCDKELLRQRIAKRTKAMLEKGLLEEARYLFMHFDTSLKPLNSIGLKECKAYLDGEISLHELETLITTHTAQLAKRQRTFNKGFDKFSLEQSKAYDELQGFMQAKLNQM
ncbi:tRNA (adenosine(37)-N6)-dimethylallyltransferase MiaA [Campylobacter sp. MIT 12-8780]|uniref:tRNA (adenosine(37)-N6)-dimethylallyltransferase MiaA n=1 Tax=unclassified Campylobacter TaxID=2593542 RepID=UPI00115D7D58|nr:MULTISPECIES: tRNA (adenosine(37)-N6)-dimethylallyltransferase MiaA [unclassified Campylobacter]NDJ27271.1 tRNA (adenosine(37)-N6)-dimethylallyltransferase MiaA [Campylobacter sp. MIT 19-121]TQR40010.1 tRNA (adenosine(37)-N6)-dimethylallyltransferase MiaA [Campylobacter sp. MIT 12-8780]